jgi:hypothetical protein
MLCVLDAVTLPPPLAEDRRITHQVLHFARPPTTRQPWILSLAATTPRRAVSEYPRLDHPTVEVRRYFSHENLPTLFEAVQKGRVTPVAFVERPGLDTHTLGQGVIDHPQGDLRLGAKHDVLGDVVFFRRTGSVAHSWGR